PADGQGEQLGVLPPAASVDLAGGVQQVERLDVADDGWEAEPAPVDVGGERAAEADAVHTGLFFADRPGFGSAGLFPQEVGDQFRPFDPGLGFDEAPLAIEVHDAVELLHVEEDGVAAELLAPHGMPSAGHADDPPLALGGPEGRLDVVNGSWLDDAVDARRIQLRLDVVDLNPFG